MPVIECSCGMVMSVSVAKPRNKCIRCGGVEFRELGDFKPVVNAMNCAPLVPITTGRNDRLDSPVAKADKVVSRIATGCSL
jgi:hypothetical protein